MSGLTWANEWRVRLCHRTWLRLLWVGLAISCLASQAVAGKYGYMEVWPFVLTSRTFRLRIPTPKPQPETLTLKVRIVSTDGRQGRTVQAQATWQDVRWPEEVWRAAGMPSDAEPRGAWIGEIPIAPTPPGRYRFSAQVVEPVEMKERRFRDSDVTLYTPPEWLHARAGIEGLDTLLKPWTPVEANRGKEGLVLACWNRRISLSQKDDLIDQITSGEDDILAAPLQLSIEDVHGRSLKPHSDWRVIENSDIQVAVRRIFASDGSRAEITLTQEYDGLTWVEVDLESVPGISKLEVRIPLNAQVAEYIYYFPDYPWYWGNIKNVIPAPRPTLGWTCSYREWFFFGGTTSGLFWWCDSKNKWQNPDEPNTVEVLSDENKVEVRLRVLKGTECVKKGSYEFAFQATPVKPWPEDPLHNRVSLFHPGPDHIPADHFEGLVRHKQQEGYKVIHLNEYWTTAWGETTPRDPEALKALAEEAHKCGMQVIVYFGWEIDETVEDFKKYSWELIGGDPRLAGFMEHHCYPGPTRKAYGDDRSGPEMERLLAGMKALLTECNIDGFYLDGTQIPTGSLRRARELMKRMRYLVDTYGTRGVIHAHTSSRNNITVNAFADVIYNGENLPSSMALAKEGKTVTGALPTDYLFLLMNGRLWGVPHDLCHHYLAYSGLAWLLDTGPDRPGNEKHAPGRRKIWIDADLWHAEYTLPHLATPRWPGRPHDVYVSYYLSEGGLYTVVVYNAQARDVEVQLPMRVVLNLDEQQKLSDPTVVYPLSGVEGSATEEGWEGVVPSCRAVVLQTRLAD